MLEQFLDNVIFISFIVLGISFLLVLIRLTRGPSLPDRVIALDMLSVLSIAFIALYSIASDEAVYLDAAIGLALVAFLGTVAFARYIEASAKGLQNSGSDRGTAEEDKDLKEGSREGDHA